MEIDKEKGFIRLFRELLNWEWYEDSNVKSLFIHCLLKANYIDKKWRAKVIKKGSFITSSENLAKELRMTRKQIRTALEKLQSTNEITCKTTSKYTYITVNNWSKYQDKENAGMKSSNNFKNINDIAELHKIFEISYPDKKEITPAAEKWLNYMREKGKKYNNKTSIESFIGKLIDLSEGNNENAKNIIENAIAHNWNGIYPIKTEDNKQNNTEHEKELAEREEYYKSLARSN